MKLAEIMTEEAARAKTVLQTKKKSSNTLPKKVGQLGKTSIQYYCTQTRNSWAMKCGTEKVLEMQMFRHPTVTKSEILMWCPTISSPGDPRSPLEENNGAQPCLDIPQMHHIGTLPGKRLHPIAQHPYPKVHWYFPNSLTKGQFLLLLVFCKKTYTHILF